MNGASEKKSAYLRRHLALVRHGRFVALLSCLVVVATAVMLMLPAVSATQVDMVGTSSERVETQVAAEEAASKTDDAGDAADAESKQSEKADAGAKAEKAFKEEAAGAESAADDSGERAEASEGGDSPGSKAASEDGEPADKQVSESGDPSASSDASGEGASEDGAAASSASASSVGSVESGAGTEMPAQSFKADLKDKGGKVTLTVEVEAPEGAFPAGTFMKIDGVDARDIQDAVGKAVSKKADGKVAQIQAVDIAFHKGDAKGEEIEPARDITVKLTSALIAETTAPLVVHVDDKGKAEVVDTLTKKQMKKRDLKADDDQLFFDADEFSTYGIVVMTIEQTLEASDGNAYTVTVTAPADAGVPGDATLDVRELVEGTDEYDAYRQQAADALGTEPGYARLFDISILGADGNKIQPAAPVAVEIALDNADDLSDDVKAVHFAGDDDVQVLDANLAGDTVSFDAESFSVYAVVDGSTDANARMKLEFYSGENLIATMYVKNGDTAAELESILYDPGAGTLGEDEVFGGWILDKPGYTTADVSNAMTIAQVRELAESLAITEGDTHRLDAAICKLYNITYMDLDGKTVLGKDAIPVKSSEYGTAEVSATVKMAYTPHDDTHNFEGWTLDTASDAHVTSAIPADWIYQNDESITIKGDISFTVNAPEGCWLVFDENGKGGKYNAPQFVKSGQVTQEPCPDSEMIRNGYTFGGWYTQVSDTADEHGYHAVVESSKFTFGSTLAAKTTLYAKWTPNAEAPYTVIFWTQKAPVNGAVSTDKTTGYDLSASYVGTGTVGQNIPYTFRDNGDEDYVTVGGADYHYTGFCMQPVSQNVEITPEGDAVLNIYFDRIKYEFRFYYYRERSGNNPYSAAQYSASYTGSGVYGVASWYGWGTNRPTQTYGADQTATVENYTAHYFVLNAYYGEDISSNWPRYDQLGDYGNYSAVSFVMMNGTGLKKEANANGYGTGHGSDTIKGLITIMDEMILGKTNDADGNFVVLRYSTKNTWQYHIFYEQVEGVDYTGKTTYTLDGVAYYEDHIVDSRSTNQNVSEQNHPQYSGFEYVAESNQTGQSGGTNENNARWTTGSGNNTVYHVRYYYDRLAYPINYMDGTYFDGDGNIIQNRNGELLHTSADIDYEATIPDTDKNYTPDLPEGEAGYVFAGWYADAACNTPYTFDTMPIGGIVVYAKWVQTEYRVFLHPNAGTDPNLSWGSDNVSTSFRVEYGGKISTPTGTREGSGYEFVGWYTDPSMGGDSLYVSDTVLNDSTVTTSYDQTEPTERDKWGNPYMNGEVYVDDHGNVLSPTSNKDHNANRFWIEKKLDLYAKWRKILEGAEGVNVVYIADDGKGNVGTNAPTDTSLYPDQAEAAAQAACKAPNGMYFKYWVIQTWDESANEGAGGYVDTELTVFPGQKFTVDESYACKQEDPDNPGEYIYTMQLRAEYGEPESELPTHIWWFGNYSDTGAVRHDSYHQNEDIQVNETVDILVAPTREGYVFLGWARVPMNDSESAEGEQGNPPTGKVLELDASNLYLKYEDGAYKLNDSASAYNGKVVTKVAADERLEYHDMYAVWQKVNTVTVKKIVKGAVEEWKTFTFTPSATLGSEMFSLGHDGSKEFGGIISGTTISVTEKEDADYLLESVTYRANSADESIEPTPIDNGEAITVNDDITITFTNKRKAFPVIFTKTDLGGNNLAGASFTLTVNNGSSYVNYPDEEGAQLTLGTATVDLPAGSYKLKENSAPAGYLVTASDTLFEVDAYGAVTITSCGEVPAEEPGAAAIKLAEATKGSSDTYTVTLRNQPGKPLPSTGGIGTLPLTLFGIALVVGAAAFLVARRRPLAAFSRELAYLNARRVMGRRVCAHKGFTRIVSSRRMGQGNPFGGTVRKR